MSDKIFKHGLAVMRCQPLHKGHTSLIDFMRGACEYVTIVLGSEEHAGRTSDNPLSNFHRKEAFANLYGDEIISGKMALKCVRNIEDSRVWGNYVLEKVKTERPNSPLPDAVFSGEPEGLKYFQNLIPNRITLVRDEEVSATAIRAGGNDHLVHAQNRYLLKHMRENL